MLFFPIPVVPRRSPVFRSRQKSARKGVILFSVSKLSHPHFKKMAQERLTLISQLTRNGYRVVLPEEYAHGDAAFFDAARAAGAKLIRTSFGRSNWIRDIFSEIGGMRFINLGGKPRGSLRETPLGECSQNNCHSPHLRC